MGGLSSDLISQFVRITNDTKKTPTESTVYGTAVEYENQMYVRLDGSELLTPVSTTADMVAGERVTVLIKNHSATVTGNVSSPSARTATVKGIANDMTALNTVVANKVSTEQLNATNANVSTLTADVAELKEATIDSATINQLKADNVEIKETLTAQNATIEDLQADKLDVNVANAQFATIVNLNATNADLHNLESTYADFEVATTNKFAAVDASISELEAGQAKITSLEADVADINTLMFGSATGDTIQTNFSNAVIAQLGAAQIKSAMIESVSADKITAGDIITNNVRVKSEDGSLIISDETMQISDENRVRVQIGKDDSGDYSINIWDVNGNLMFSKGGITDSAIKEAIIRNDMVSDTANIAAHKLDIDSLFSEINGSTNTIKSTKILLDDENQTLDIAFKSVTDDVNGLKDDLTSQGTQITAIQAHITSKIWQTDIDTAVDAVDTKTETLSTKYTELNQELDSVAATVASHTSTLTNKADSSTVTEVNNRVTSLAANLYGFESSVSETYATKYEATEIQNGVNNLEIGGRNLVAGTDEITEYVGNAAGTTNNYKDVWSAKTIDIPSGTDYIISFDAKADVAQTIRCHFYSPNTTTSSVSSTGQRTTGGDGSIDVTITTKWARYWVKWTQSATDARKNIIIGRNFSENNIYIRAVKFEAGHKPTDWTPAPEDMATGKDVISVNNSIEATNTRVTETESMIQQLSESIMTLVRDENGESLMIQTEDGWTFSTAQIQSVIDETSKNLDNLTNSVGDVTSAVDVLQQAVNDLGVLTDYVKITTYENEPCIELGETDSDFKLLITNTRIMFMEGSSVPAYINNQSLFINKAVIEEELQQGEFVWKARSNGNLGLIWKGGA